MCYQVLYRYSIPIFYTRTCTKTCNEAFLSRKDGVNGLTFHGIFQSLFWSNLSPDIRNIRNSDGLMSVIKDLEIL